MKLAGIAELAEFLGVSKQTVANIRARGNEVHGLSMPMPIATLRMSPIWDLDTPEMRDFAIQYQQQVLNKRRRINDRRAQPEALNE